MTNLIQNNLSNLTLNEFLKYADIPENLRIPLEEFEAEFFELNEEIEELKTNIEDLENTIEKQKRFIKDVFLALKNNTRFNQVKTDILSAISQHGIEN